MGSPRMLRVELRGLAEGMGREGEAGKERSYELGFPCSGPGSGSLVVSFTGKGKAEERATLGKEAGDQEFAFGLL